MYSIKCNDCNALAINGYASHELNCCGIMNYIDSKGKVFIKYQVWSLDVWGNSKDGFEVNDRSRCKVIMIPLNSDDRDIIKALKSAGLLNKRCHFKSFEIDDYGISASKTGMPLYQFEIE